MAIKTISLELDAYEKLRRAKRGGESFSAVVRRTRFDQTAAEAVGTVQEPAGGYGISAGSVEASPDYWDRVEAKERRNVALESFDAASSRQQERNQVWAARAGGKTAASGRGWTRADLYTERMPNQ